jgi:hypothetical protein
MPTLLLRVEQHKLERLRGENEMPIVDGKYEAKIGTTFATVEEGIAELKRMIQKSRKIRISNIPMNLLEELKPLLNDKDLMIILPMNEKPTEELKQLAPMTTTKARIYVDYKGEEANSGSITFARLIFNVAWVNDKILNVSTMEYGKCVKCMAGSFEGGWRYSQKW